MAAALAGLLMSCAAAEDADTVQELRAELASRSEDQQELIDRVEQLEAELARLTDDTTTTARIDDLDDVMARLSASTERRQDELEAEADTRQLAIEDGEVATAALRDGLQELRGQVDELRGEIDELRVLYETLRDRLDRQQRG
jgi:archaellum component FlaC